MKYDLPSGAVFDVTIMPYEKAWALSQTAIKLLGEMKVDIPVGIDMTAFLKEDVLALKGPICAVLSSPVLMPAVKEAWGRCSYNGLKIDPMTFNAPEARGDFLYCAFYALKENIAPFFASLSSFFASLSTGTPTPPAA